MDFSCQSITIDDGFDFSIWFDDETNNHIELIAIKVKSKFTENKENAKSVLSDIEFLGKKKPSVDLNRKFSEDVTFLGSFKSKNKVSNQIDTNYVEDWSVVDPRLELIDPNPDLFKLFKEFDRKFFNDFLSKCHFKVEWSGSLTKSAGLFIVTQKEAKIRLSTKLLGFRPRKDLVETLLHEMIHAYIFFCRLKDDGDHGQTFQNIMWNINKAAGTNISVYHSFHQEIRYHEVKRKLPTK